MRGALAEGIESCVHSFAAATLVATPTGAKAISLVVVGDTVTAEDPETGRIGTYAVTATFVHQDPVTGTVTIDGEKIGTTPHHRFLTIEEGWVDAEDLIPGEHVPSVRGAMGLVSAIRWDAGGATMYDLTVASVHTFAVGAGGWVVHNCGWTSFARAKTVLGPTGKGYVYDHVVEQSQILKSRFDPQIIHSAANLRRVPSSVNNAKAAIYNSYDELLTGVPKLRVRDWLTGQPFDVQYAYGQQVLRRLMSGQ